MNINISGDQDEMSGPARQALRTTKYTMQRTKRQHPVTLLPGSEGLCQIMKQSVVERDETQIYF
jgi:hypothetical protein